MKTTEAKASCSPYPCSGKVGDRIQISNGTQQMRLIVMELGRFTLTLGPGTSNVSCCPFEVGSQSFRAALAASCPGPHLHFCPAEPCRDPAIGYLVIMHHPPQPRRRNSPNSWHRHTGACPGRQGALPQPARLMLHPLFFAPGAGSVTGCPLADGSSVATTSPWPPSQRSGPRVSAPPLVYHPLRCFSPTQLTASGPACLSS